MFRLVILPFFFISLSISFVLAQTNAKHYLYDKVDLELPTEKLGSDEYYDSDHVINGNKMYLCWVEFVPEKGDFLWVGKWLGGKVLWQKRVNEVPGKYQNPKIKIASNGQVIVTYEKEEPENGNWNIYMVLPEKGDFTTPFLISKRNGININHVIATDSKGGFWCAWQMANIGQFDIVVSHVPDLSNPVVEKLKGISDINQGDWDPSIAINTLDEVMVCWDTYGSTGFDVVAKKYTPVKERWSDTISIAVSKAFEGKTDIVSDANNNFIIIWEIGGENWGEKYIGNRNGYKINQMDSYGPLHRYRYLKMAKYFSLEDSIVPFEKPFPMPMLEWASKRNNMKPGTSFLGCFYERAKLAIDKKDRIWVTYRHFYAPQVGFIEDLQDSYEDGWKIYTRCFSGNKWSGVTALDAHQRYGMQNLSTFVNEKGLSILYTVGNSGKGKLATTKGIVRGFIDEKKIPSKLAEEEEEEEKLVKLEPGITQLEQPPKFEKKQLKQDGLQLFLGDLHRHTDLSLKFPFFDGSLVDAYRYAFEVAKLDFLAITDNSEDLANGNPNSQIWWRNVKEISRHRIPGKMAVYYGFEREGSEINHHVVSTDKNVLKSHLPPLQEFWDLLKDSVSITIPHLTVDSAGNLMNNNLWEEQDPVKRPLVEIYQGFRHDSLSEEVHKGWANGYHFGLSAGSDHLSCNGGFLGVWAKEKNESQILGAIINRRTFAATTKMSLVFKSGNSWMGEIIKTSYLPEFQINVESPVAIKAVLVISGGEVVQKFNPDPKNNKTFQTSFIPRVDFTSTRYFYIKVVMVNENWAWSSPIWLEKW